MKLFRNIITPILLLLIFNACTSSNGSDKYSEIKNFPEFTASSNNVQLKQLTGEDENVLRAYVSRNKKELIVIAGIKNTNPAQKNRSYRFLVYDEDLKLIKKIEAPELNGLFGADDVGDLYVDKGFFQHKTYTYKPIRQIWVTQDPTQFKLSEQEQLKSVLPPMIVSLDEMNDMVKRQDTLLSFVRRDYLGFFYYMKKSGSVYQILFKDCPYCEGKYNKEWSVSEYRAEDSGMETSLRPVKQNDKAWLGSKAPNIYELKLGFEDIRFKIPYSDKPGLPIKMVTFSGKPMLTYQEDPTKNSKLYYFQQGYENIPVP